MGEQSDDATVAKANLVEHLKNIDIACDDARVVPTQRRQPIEEATGDDQNKSDKNNGPRA